jgi:hypothetical protein
MAYALSAERIFGQDDGFLDANPACVPIFVSLLFQSLEISIKQAGLESGLFLMQEARSRQQRSGHGIKELAALAVEKLGGDPFDPIVMAMTFASRPKTSREPNSAEIIRCMICGAELEKTRELYASRSLGYAQVAKGDFAIIQPVKHWIAAVKETAANLLITIDILSQWKTSPSSSKHFAIWCRNQANKPVEPTLDSATHRYTVRRRARNDTKPLP